MDIWIPEAGGGFYPNWYHEKKWRGAFPLECAYLEKGMFQAGPQPQVTSFHAFSGLLDPVWGLRVGVEAQCHSSLELDWNGA